MDYDLFVQTTSNIMFMVEVYFTREKLRFYFWTTILY